MPTLDDYNDAPTPGPTSGQLAFIRELAEQCDLSDDEVLDLAIGMIPDSRLENREITTIEELSVKEASDLIEELKAARRPDRR